MENDVATGVIQGADVGVQFMGSALELRAKTSGSI